MPCYDVSMHIKSPNKNHPFIKFFAPLLSIFILLISCSKPAQESANRETTAQEETAITLPEQNESESKESGEEKSEKEREPEAQETLSDGYIEVGSYFEPQESDFYINFDGNLGGIEGYFSAKKTALAIGKNDFRNGEVITVDDETQKIIYRQTIKAFSDEEVSYRAVYKYFDFSKTFEYTECALENHTINVNTESTIEQVHGKIINAKDDPEKIYMIELFETYINTHHPYYQSESPEKPYTVLDYIKGTFTNSGNDEYIVFFTQGKKTCELTGYEYDSTDGISCFVLKNNTVQKVYKLFCYSGIPFRSSYIVATSTFGEEFFEGWVADFNQNTINEIFLGYFIEPFYVFYSVEFNQEKDVFDTFRIGYYIDRVQPDWDNKILKVRHTTRFALNKYVAIIQWNEADNRYWFISDKLQKKEE